MTTTSGFAPAGVVPRDLLLQLQAQGQGGGAGEAALLPAALARPASSGSGGGGGYRFDVLFASSAGDGWANVTIAAGTLRTADGAAAAAINGAPLRLSVPWAAPPLPRVAALRSSGGAGFQVW